MMGCNSCIYFTDREQPGSGWGRCRFNPPVVVPHHDDLTEFLQPRVSSSDWCGKYIQRKPKGVERAA